MADEPPIPPETIDALPDSVISSVLDTWGYKDSQPEDVASTDGNEEEQVPPVETEEEAPGPSAPGGTLFTPEDKDLVTLPDGRKYPIALIQEWADRSTGLPPEPAPVSVPQSVQEPAVVPQLAFPTVTEEDLELAGPAVRALLLIANAQAQQQRQLQERIDGLSSIATERAQRESAEIANSAASSFQSKYDIPEELMDSVKKNVQVSDLESYLSRDPDPFKATEYALNRAFWTLPQARQFQAEREDKWRQSATSRKRKLAGVSGSSGTGPSRTPVFEDTQEGRYAAAVEEVARDMGLRE